MPPNSPNFPLLFLLLFINRTDAQNPDSFHISHWLSPLKVNVKKKKKFWLIENIYIIYYIYRLRIRAGRICRMVGVTASKNDITKFH